MGEGVGEDSGVYGSKYTGCDVKLLIGSGSWLPVHGDFGHCEPDIKVSGWQELVSRSSVVDNEPGHKDRSSICH